MSYSANRVCALESSFLIHVFCCFFLVCLNDDQTKQKTSGIIEDNVTTKGEGDGLTTVVEDGVVTRGSDSDVTKVAMMVRMIRIMSEVCKHGRSTEEPDHDGAGSKRICLTPQ